MANCAPGDRFTRTMAAFRCTGCGALAGEEDVQMDLGRCPVCGTPDCEPTGRRVRVVYEVTATANGRPLDLCIVEQDPPRFAD